MNYQKIYKLESNTFLQMELTKLTSKGQVVIPVEIRRELQLKKGSQIVVTRFRDLVLMKKITIPDPKKELKKLTKIGSKIAKEKGIKTEEDVISIIQRGRGLKSA